MKCTFNAMRGTRSPREIFALFSSSSSTTQKLETAAKLETRKLGSPRVGKLDQRLEEEEEEEEEGCAITSSAFHSHLVLLCMHHSLITPEED